jgi:phage protein U
MPIRCSTIAGLCLLAMASDARAGEQQQARKTRITVTIQPVDSDLSAVEATFNPREISVEKAVPWRTSRDSTEDSPAVDFTAPEPRRVTLHLDVEDVADLRKLAERLETLALVDTKLRRPPMVTVTWGGSLTFKGVIESLSQRFTMFLADGTPTQAEVHLQLREASRAGLRKCASDDDCAQGQTCANSLCQAP